MLTVYKHMLHLSEQPQLVTQNEPFKILHVGMQDMMPTIWFLIDTGSGGQITRELAVYGTGHSIEEFTNYIGTVVGTYVWHIFELSKPQIYVRSPWAG